MTIDTNAGTPKSRIRLVRAGWVLLCLLSMSACSSAGRAPRPDQGRIFGRIHAVPREGVSPGRKTSGPYGEPVLSSVEFVDYQRPGFSVISYDGSKAPASESYVLEIQESESGRVRIVPEEGAIGVSQSLKIRNSDSKPRTVSCPVAGFIETLEPGAEAQLAAPKQPGALRFHVLGSKAVALVYAAAGVFAVADDDGDYELNGLSPGSGVLQVWAPRFPSRSLSVTVVAGKSLEQDLELRVENIHKH